MGGKGADGRNAEFIDEMIKDPVFADMLDPPGDNENTDPVHGHNHSHSHSHGNGNARGGPSKQGDRDSSQEKVRSTLRSFVRDWSDYGKDEREACYSPILEVLGREFPDERGGRKVLVGETCYGGCCYGYVPSFRILLVCLGRRTGEERQSPMIGARLEGGTEGLERKMGN
jgi:hypothetical protein